ncbi:rod shape-determining protein MreC [Ferroacidibacillus organovorans]|uniref:Cell shape-determining protein MreC n=2 Tax=Ferroacidibacillus organovorans TaxID=1765683 RepID=A0A101XSI9_9BACL|nr:rod shape-determining protein MreC [Ferroacidibacillus organovorans]KUO96745.1 hypothetical protein ATW55_07955 [Ferroacidibacillus organovorans]
MSRLFSGGRLLGFLAGLIVLFIVAAVTLHNRAFRSSWPERAVRDVTSIVSEWLYTPTFQVETFFSRIKDLTTLYQENSALQALVAKDAALQISLDQTQQENAQLRQMVGYRSANPQYKLIAARVTGRSPLTWDSDITISVGKNAGVARDMPVLNQNGALVGRITSSSNLSSVVSLLTSSASADGVSANIVNGKQATFGIVSGNATVPNDLLMQFISQMSTNARVGDLVVTSGLSNMYPRGILIGKVQSFQLDGTGITKSAVIAPAANFNAIDYVFVLVPKPGQVIP